MARAESLVDLLGQAPPGSVTALPDDVLDRLVNQVRSARAHQAEVVEESVRVALRGVPLPVRGVIRKAIL